MQEEIKPAPVPEARPEAGSHWRERYRVRIGFGVGVLFIWRAQPRSLVLLSLGLLAALAGVLVRQWAAGCVKKMDELAVSGPYRLVRHPLYFGSFLAAAGFIFASTSFSLAVTKPFLDRSLFFWCALWALIDSIYLPKILNEEEALKAKFPGQYEAFSRDVPRLFPRKFKGAELDFSTFSWSLWRKNEEYWSLLGYALISAVLVARYILR